MKKMKDLLIYLEMVFCFITEDKSRDKGNTYMGCRCRERLRVKDGGGESLTHTRWSGEMGYLRRGKCRRP
jgi:hypothetical protein